MKADRRRRPRIWDTDWLVLRQISRLLSEQVQSHVPRGSTMIDLGCGDMPYRTMMKEFGIKYAGADIDHGADLPISHDGSVPIGPSSVDTVLSVQVLEHVLDIDAYLAEVRRLLREDGILLLSTHGTWLYHPHPQDHRRWTRTGLVADLRSHGLEVQDIFPIVGPLATTTLIRSTAFAFVVRKLPVLGRPLGGAIAIAMNLRAILEDKITPSNIVHDNACVYLVRARKMLM